MHRNRLCILLVVAIAALCVSTNALSGNVVDYQQVSAVVNISPCTPATCIGPVQVYFQNANCTGNVVFYELPWKYEANVCVNTSQTSDPLALALESHRYITEGNQVILTSYWQSDVCLESEQIRREVSRFKYNVCIPTLFIDPVQDYANHNIAYGRPHMFLANVNASIPSDSALVTVPGVEMPYNPIEERCVNVAEGCVSDSPNITHLAHYNVQYASEVNTCPANDYQVATATFGVYAGTCYALAGGYYKFDCDGDHGVVHHYYAGNGCQVWVGSYSERYHCENHYPQLYFSQYCISYPDIIPSSSSRLSWSSIATIVLLIAQMLIVR